MVPQARIPGPSINPKNVVRTARRLEESGRQLVEEEAAGCFCGGAFPQSFRKKGVRGLSPKA